MNCCQKTQQINGSPVNEKSSNFFLSLIPNLLSKTLLWCIVKKLCKEKKVKSSYNYQPNHYYLLFVNKQFTRIYIYLSRYNVKNSWDLIDLKKNHVPHFGEPGPNRSPVDVPEICRFLPKKSSFVIKKSSRGFLKHFSIGKNYPKFV